MPMYTSGIPKSGMLEIGIALVLHDQFTTGMDQASKEVRKLYRDAQNGVMANLNAAVGIAEMGENLFGGMISSIASATEEAVGFMDTMVSVGAITEATNQQMETLADTARRVGFGSIFSIPEVGSGMKYLAMAGATVDEINNMIGAATNVAGATGLALGGKGGAADVITNVMRTYQAEAYRAEEVGDIMTKAALRSNISMSDMAASIRYASADVTNLGYSLEETSAMIGTLGNMGIQGSMAGTAIANMMRYLSKSISDPAYKGAKALASLGLTPEELTDAKGGLLSIDIILSKIRDATAGLSEVDRLNYMTQIFGVRGNRAATALTRDLEGYRQLLQQVTDSYGYASKIMEQRMDSLFGTVERFKESITNLKTVYTQSIEPIIKPLIKTATSWLQGLANIMENKVFGPTIGFFTVSIPLIGRFLSFMVKWRAAYLLLARTDTIVTLKNIWTILTKGWAAANTQATTYLGTLQAINAAHAGVAMSGFMPAGMAVGKGAARGLGPSFTPIVKGGKKRGITYHGTRRDGTPIFIDNRTKRFAKMDDPRVEKYFKDVLVATKKGKYAGAAGTVARVGAGVSNFGKGIYSLMGGGWGMAITAILTLGPLLVNAISSRREANRINKEQKVAMEANSRGLDSNTAAVGTLASKYDSLAEAEEAGKTLSLEREMILLRNSIQYWHDLIQSNAPFTRTEITLRDTRGNVLGTYDLDQYNKEQNLNLATK